MLRKKKTVKTVKPVKVEKKKENVNGVIIPQVIIKG